MKKIPPPSDITKAREIRMGGDFYFGGGIFYFCSEMKFLLESSTQQPFGGEGGKGGNFSKLSLYIIIGSRFLKLLIKNISLPITQIATPQKNQRCKLYNKKISVLTSLTIEDLL